MGGQGRTPVCELCPRPSARRGCTAGLRALEPPHPPGLQLQPHSSGLGKEPVLPPSARPEGPAPECGAKSPRATARTCGSNGPWGIPADLDLPAAPVGGAAWDMPPGERSGRLSRHTLKASAAGRPLPVPTHGQGTPGHRAQCHMQKPGRRHPVQRPEEPVVAGRGGADRSGPASAALGAQPAVPRPQAGPARAWHCPIGDKSPFRTRVPTVQAWSHRCPDNPVVPQATSAQARPSGISDSGPLL